MHIERRKHRRFQVKDNAFTVINSDPVKVVPIIDIGMGGLGIYLRTRSIGAAGLWVGPRVGPLLRRGSRSGRPRDQ